MGNPRQFGVGTAASVELANDRGGVLWIGDPSRWTAWLDDRLHVDDLGPRHRTPVDVGERKPRGVLHIGFEG